MGEHEPEMVTSWRCTYCKRKRYASKTATRRHMEICSMNPKNKTCSTCVHFRRTPCCDVGSDECGCMGRNECMVDAFEKWRYDDHDTLTPKDDGWWTHVVDWRRDCPQYLNIPGVDPST